MIVLLQWALAGLSQGPESLSSVFLIFLWALVQDGRCFCVDCQICTLNLICLFPPSTKALDCRGMEKWKKEKKKKRVCEREWEERGSTEPCVPAEWPPLALQTSVIVPSKDIDSP